MKNYFLKKKIGLVDGVLKVYNVIVKVEMLNCLKYYYLKF